MSDQAHAMRIFVTVVDTGSFSAAAKQMRLGQPAVSKSVAALEERLGVQLLARSTRTQSLTEAGRRYYERANLALEEIDAAEAAARDEAVALTGRLRISAPPVYADRVILPRVSRFLDAHKGISLDFALEDRRTDLVEEGVDLAIRSGSLQDTTMVARRIDRTQRILVASPSYLDQSPPLMHPRDLKDHDLVSYIAWDNRTSWRFERKGAVETVSIEPRIRLSAAQGVVSGAFFGLGAAMVTDRMVGDAIDRGELVALLPDWQLPTNDVWVIFPQGRRVRRKARVFVDWLETELRALAAKA